MVEMLQPFLASQHPDYYCVSWPDGRLRCKYTWQKFIGQNERIESGLPKKVSIEKFVAPGEPMVFEDKIFVSDDENCPNFVIDPRKLALLLPALWRRI